MSEPLTKDKIRCVPPEYIEEHGCECCCKNTKVMLKDDVLSAVMLLREKAYCWHNGCSYWAEKARPECFEEHMQSVKVDFQQVMIVFGGVEK